MRLGYLKQTSRNKYHILNRRELAIRWAEEYDHVLRPTLSRGLYRFADRTMSKKWQSINFMDRAFWSGESGAALFSSVVKPNRHVIYSQIANGLLAKEFKIFRDPTGNIEVLDCFWDTAEESGDNLIAKFNQPFPGNSVAPLVVLYADLARLGDSRLSKIAHGYLQNYLSMYD